MYRMWTKRKLPQRDGDEVGPAVTVPRFIRLEYRMSRWSRDDAPPAQILLDIRETMQRQAEISGPFVQATITKEGFSRVQ